MLNLCNSLRFLFSVDVIHPTKNKVVVVSIHPARDAIGPRERSKLRFNLYKICLQLTTHIDYSFRFYEILLHDSLVCFL